MTSRTTIFTYQGNVYKVRAHDEFFSSSFAIADFYIMREKKTIFGKKKNIFIKIFTRDKFNGWYFRCSHMEESESDLLEKYKQAIDEFEQVQHNLLEPIKNMRENILQRLQFMKSDLNLLDFVWDGSTKLKEEDIQKMLEVRKQLDKYIKKVSNSK